MRRWVWVWVVAAACNGPVSVADYPDAYVDALCTYLTRCGEFPDVDTCKSANVRQEADISGNTKAAIDNGTIVWDGDAARECVDQIAAQTCDKTDESGRSSMAPCSRVVRGTVGDGGACAFDQECASRSCNVPTCSMACCQGTCTGDALPAPGGPGTPCRYTTDCTPDTFCDYTTSSHVCTALKGIARPCLSTEECAYGLGCAGQAGDMTCRPLPEVGEPCPDGVCRDVGDYCSIDHICKHQRLAGDACNNGLQCSAFYPCDVHTDQCTKAPTTGQPCTMFETCFDPGTFCDTTQAQPVCLPLRADGVACTGGYVCKSHYCDPSGVCAEPPVCI